MNRWVSTYAEAQALVEQGGRIIAWPFPGCSYGNQWCIFIANQPVRG